MVKKLLAVLLFIFAANYNCQPLQLKSFAEIFDNIKAGAEVRVVIHYGNCKLFVDGKEETPPEDIGGMELKTFEYFGKGSIKNDAAFISASETVLISHPKYGYVYNYIKIRIYDNDSVEIIARYLDPKSYEVKMDETFRTKINNGKNEGAAFFYLN